MPDKNYILEIDYFSGRANPVFRINKEDFHSLYGEVMKLERTNLNIFDGLGFRGFKISDSLNMFLTVQKNIIKIDSDGIVHFKKNNGELRSKMITLVRKYAKGNKYQDLISEIGAEYL